MMSTELSLFERFGGTYMRLYAGEQRKRNRRKRECQVVNSQKNSQ
jgi:hypothetical protein